VVPSEVFTADFMKAIEGFEPLTSVRNYYHSAPARNVLNRWLYIDLKITITDNDLRKVTTMADAAGVTVRYPLLDPDLVLLSGTIPARFKVRGSRLRYIFKKAMADFLPEEILNKKKHGFGLPYAVWLAEHTKLREFTFDVLGTKRSRERGLFRPDLSDWLWTRYKTISPMYYGEILWMYLMLELWFARQHDLRSLAR
jgi:asparagine synthase (glutamine-hydrolysing)